MFLLGSGLKSQFFISPLLLLSPTLSTLQNNINDSKVARRIGIHNTHWKLPLRDAWKNNSVQQSKGKGKPIRENVRDTKQNVLDTNDFREALILLVNRVETTRTHPVERMAPVLETRSQAGIDLEATVIGRQLQRQSRVGLLFKALVSI